MAFGGFWFFYGELRFFGRMLGWGIVGLFVWNSVRCEVNLFGGLRL